jgi:malonyl-CoA decarboxylase
MGSHDIEHMFDSQPVYRRAVNVRVEPNLLRRAVGGLTNSWQNLIRRGDPLAAVQPDLAERDADRIRAAVDACLRASGGEVSARARAAALGRAYLSLNESGKARFLELLAEFDADRGEIARAVSAVGEAADETGFGDAARALRIALQPPWLRLLRQFNELPDGTKFLVDLRGALLDLKHPSPAVRRLELDLKELLASWFDTGFLELRRVTWDAPATFLEKLGRYEAVHEVRGWEDLKNRLDSDRRCFAYVHPAMPNEPLIFVEVALVEGMSEKIGPLLDSKAPLGDPGEASTAVFYSISNCQRGLAGISFGNALIKGVVDALSSEFRRLRVFATLSPMPGFRHWLEARAADDGLVPDVVTSTLSKKTWYRDATLAGTLRRPLLRLGAQYLLETKADDDGVSDAVARFHLSNGARLERLNWLADTSAKGIRDAAGLMVNYVYRVDEIDANHEAYTGDGSIAASRAVYDLLKPRR